MITKKELFRQIMHALIGIVIVIGFYFNIITPLIVFLLLILTGLFSILSRRAKIPIINKIINKFEREDIKTKFPGKGIIFFLMGCLLAMQLFSKDIASASILILALGDSISHIIGMQYGKTKNIFNWKSPKLLEGTLAGILLSFLGALIFVSWLEALLAAIAAMAFEVIEIDLNGEHLDDNLIIPLIAGTVILILRLI
jgi:dolichol kinase